MAKVVKSHGESDPQTPPAFRSDCPIARTLDILGDKWTLLVIRDLLFTEKKRYGELVDSPERIPTNILSDRLKRLESFGIVSRNLYNRRPPRAEYLLTERGHELVRILKSMYEWGSAHFPDMGDVSGNGFEGTKKT